MKLNSFVKKVIDAIESQEVKNLFDILKICGSLKENTSNSIDKVLSQQILKEIHESIWIIEYLEKNDYLKTIDTNEKFELRIGNDDFLNIYGDLRAWTERRILKTPLLKEFIENGYLKKEEAMKLAALKQQKLEKKEGAQRFKIERKFTLVALIISSVTLLTTSLVSFWGIQIQNQALIDNRNNIEITRNSLNEQIKRWNKQDETTFEGKKELLDNEWIDTNRRMYVFSIDIAVFEEAYFSDTPHEKKIAVRIYDLWDITAAKIEIDGIKDEEDLQNAWLDLNRFKFVFEPMDKKISEIRTYREDHQKEILLALRDLINETIKNVDKLSS